MDKSRVAVEDDDHDESSKSSKILLRREGRSAISLRSFPPLIGFSCWATFHPQTTQQLSQSYPKTKDFSTSNKLWTKVSLPSPRTIPAPKAIAMALILSCVHGRE